MTLGVVSKARAKKTPDKTDRPIVPPGEREIDKNIVNDNKTKSSATNSIRPECKSMLKLGSSAISAMAR